MTPPCRKMNPLWVGVNPLPQKSEPPGRGFYQNIRPNTEKQISHSGCLLFFLCEKGTRTMKSDMPVACQRRRLDGAEPLFCSFGAKCKRVPSGVPPPGSGSNPSVKNQRFLPVPFTQGSLCLFPKICTLTFISCVFLSNLS